MVKCKHYVSQKQNGSIIRTSGTIFCSLSYFNSRIGFNGLKYFHSVISVIDKRLPGNTKKSAIAPFVDDQGAISCIMGGFHRVVFFSPRKVLSLF